VAGFLDLFSRKVVGLAMVTQMRSELVERALGTARDCGNRKRVYCTLVTEAASTPARLTESACDSSIPKAIVGITPQ
jgi:hypothetical protein